MEVQDIHKIVFQKKGFSRENVDKVLREIGMENKKVKELKLNFVVQVHPKSHFSSKISKQKVSKNVNVFSGTLKPKYSGSGLFSKVGDYFKKGYTALASVGNVVKKNLPAVVDTAKKAVDVGTKVLFESDKPTEGKFIRDPRMPDNKTLWKMASQAYMSKPDDNVDGYELLCATDTLKFYWKDRVVVCAIRGTADQKDIKADLKIPLGSLENTPRFKKDLEDFKDCMKDVKKFGVDVVFGVGHSLGSGILDLFISKNLIEQGVSYNGAIEKKFMGSNKNYRIYLNEDEVLYQLMGKYANPESREVREKSPLKKAISETGDVGKVGVALQSHLLDNFKGGSFQRGTCCMCGKSPVGKGKSGGATITDAQKKQFMKMKGFKQIMDAYIAKQNSLQGSGRAEELLAKMKDGSFQKALDQASTDKGKALQSLMGDVYDKSDFWDDAGDWFKKAGTDVNQFLKDNKVLSTLADVGTALSAIIPGFEEFAPALGVASSALSSEGYGAFYDEAEYEGRGNVSSSMKLKKISIPDVYTKKKALSTIDEIVKYINIISSIVEKMPETDRYYNDSKSASNYLFESFNEDEWKRAVEKFHSTNPDFLNNLNNYVNIINYFIDIQSRRDEKSSLLSRVPEKPNNLLAFEKYRRGNRGIMSNQGRGNQKTKRRIVML